METHGQRESLKEAWMTEVSSTGNSDLGFPFLLSRPKDNGL